MFCSPLLHPDPTVIPRPVREWLGARLGGPPRGTRRPRRRACLYALGRLGDFVLMLSALRLLVREFGAKECVLVIPAAVAPLAAREFPGVACLTLPAEGPSLVRDILPAWRRERDKFAGEQFATCVCLRHQRTLYHEVTFSWIEAARTHRLEPGNYPAWRDGGLPTELEGHRQLVAAVLGRPVGPEEILPAFTSQDTGDDGRLLVYPLSQDVERCLPPDLVIAVLQAWRERSRAPIVFGGGPELAAGLGRYADAARRAGLAPVAVETPAGLDGFIDHLAGAGAVLASESAAAHIATALDKPAVILTGGGLQGLCYPWRRSARQRSVQNPLPCFGCGWRCTQAEMFCLTQLPAATAAAALPAL